jgi:tetratricopeptide (TPR) repeat protein
MPLKLTENQLEEIASLMDNEKWEDAKKELLKHRQTNDGRVYFLLGVLFNDWHNPNKDEKEAKRFFELSVDSDNPPSNAFIQLSMMERNRIHALRILRNGLKIYPKNEPLYYYLMLYSEPSDRETVYFEAIKNECISERIKITMAQAYFTLAKHSECVKLIAEIRPDNEGDVEVLKCMKGFSVYELGNHAEAASIFEELIESDINHMLFFGLNRPKIYH